MKAYVKYLGIPRVHLGRTMKGLDCFGLILLYFKQEFGIELPDWYYDEDWFKKGENYFINNYSQHAIRVSKPKVNDIVFFKPFKNTSFIDHCGIIIEPPDKIIHCSKFNVILSTIKSKMLVNRVEGFYRVCLL